MSNSTNEFHNPKSISCHRSSKLKKRRRALDTEVTFQTVLVDQTEKNGDRNTIIAARNTNINENGSSSHQQYELDKDNTAVFKYISRFQNFLNIPKHTQSSSFSAFHHHREKDRHCRMSLEEFKFPIQSSPSLNDKDDSTTQDGPVYRYKFGTCVPLSDVKFPKSKS